MMHEIYISPGGECFAPPPLLPGGVPQVATSGLGKLEEIPRKIFIAIRVSGDDFFIGPRMYRASIGGQNREKLMFLELIQDDFCGIPVSYNVHRMHF